MQTVSFKRKADPSELVVIRYDDVAVLKAKGILKDTQKISTDPQAFPKPRDVAPGFARAPVAIPDSNRGKVINR